MKIGLEVHVGLPTSSKLFCRCKTYAVEPNSAICPICTGMPGSKPLLNKKALELSLDIANALNCKIPKQMSFVRKVYFYPDLPKSFQITQKESPVGMDGFVLIGDKKIRITRVQLEEDPAKMLREDNYTLIDYNRSGQPLVEIVTAPDISTEDELKSFIITLKSILYYLDVDIERELKADLNISLTEVRVEVKNITGIKNMIDAARYEIQRQEKLINENQSIARETRSYSDIKLATVSSREKESDEEYGFIFDPDLAIYATKNIQFKKPTFTRFIASEYSKKYTVTESQILELIQFNKTALLLVDEFKDKYKLKDIMNSISLIQRYGKEKPTIKNTEKVIIAIQTGYYPDQKDILSVESGKEISIPQNIISTQIIDGEIRLLIDKNKHLLKEYLSNKKALNFIIGSVVKKYKANPRVVSERLEVLLSSEYKVE